MAVGFAMGPAGLAGLLTGSIVSGSALAVMLSNAGGAWDNTKKFIEAGAHGGKGSDNHKVRQCAAMTVCYGIGSRVYHTAKVHCMVPRRAYVLRGDHRIYLSYNYK